MTLRFLLSPLRWGGMVLWVWSHARKMGIFFEACANYENSFGTVVLPSTTRYVRFYAISILLVTAFYIYHMLTYFGSHPVWLQVALITGMCGMTGGGYAWLAILDGMCLSLADAFHEVNQRLPRALRKDNVPQLRRLTRQHGCLSQLAGMLCATFGSLLTIWVYTMVLDLSLSIYTNARSGSERAGDVGSLVRAYMERLLSLLPVVLLKLTTNAGHRVRHESARASELLQGHLLAGSQTADRLLYTELLDTLHRQQVHMSMDGYFTLDREFFIQSMKDVMTLVIALAQFDMAA